MALFTVLDLRATMFSRGKVCVYDLEGNEIPNDPFLVKIANPNFAQSQQDFLYQHLFFKSLGNNITKVTTPKNRENDITSVKSLDNLVPDCIDYNGINKTNKFIFSRSDIDEYADREIKYTLDNKTYSIPIKQLAFFYDVSNGLEEDSVFISPSRLDALQKPLKNVQQAQKTKNINLKFSAKHIISRKDKKQTGDGTYSGILIDNKERTDVEEKVYRKNVFASGEGFEVHSLASDFRKLMLDDSCNSDLLKISGAYGMTKDVISWALNGASTYDNRQTAVVDWIQNSIQFEGDDWSNTWTTKFNYLEQGKKIVMKWDHLPIMQIIEETRMKTIQLQLEIAESLVGLGYTNEDALEKVGINK